MKRCMGCMELYKEDVYMCPHCGYEENTLPEEAFHLVPGTIIGKRYMVGKVLGFGGFGVTYIGYDELTDKKVAIKEYLPSEFATRMPTQTKVTIYSGEKTEQFGLGMSKFVEEAKKLAKFSETSEIVNVYDCISENDTAYIIMELLEGESLKQYLERKKKVSVEEAERIILPIFRSLHSVHEIGLIHRDIAPDNIFMTKDGRVKLLDFGAARYASATHSRSLSVIYKPGYAPEEQYQSRGEQGPWTDVYALAATMYKMITGVTPATSLERRAKDTLKPPSKLGVSISKNKETALMNALNVQVKNRTKSAEAFLKEWESQGEVARIIDTVKQMDVGKLSKKAKIAILSCVAAVGAAVVIAFATGGLEKITDTISIQDGKTRVPSVVNTTIEDAQNRLSEAELQMEITGREYSAEIKKDLILTQAYKSGTLVASKQKMGVVVSGGIRQIYMPEVSGKTQTEAVKTLEDTGFQVLVEEIYSAVVIGNVIRTSCEVGSVCDEGTKVTIYISKGIDPATIVEDKKYVVEDFTGKTVEEVQNILEAEGIYLDPSAKAYSDTVAAGSVISQNIPVGTELKAGSTISVEVSLGKEMVRIPELWLAEEAVAREKLAGLALDVHWEYAYSSEGVQEGLVMSLSIEEGQEVDKGTLLTVVISKGPEPTATPTPEPTATSTPTPVLPTPTTHVHNYNWDIQVVDAGCVSNGLISYICSCGESQSEKIYAIGHDWNDATCTSAKTCKNCGVTEGSAKGHNWNDATCTSAKTCKNCGATEGSAKGHSWNDATCTSAKTCKNCGATEGSAKGHNWNDATCTSAKTCKNCGATEGSAKGHNWNDATCTSAKTCKNCGATEGSAKGHNWNDATCTSAKTCKNCGATEGSAKGHNWNDATCTSAKTCKNCGATEGSATGHLYSNDTDLDCNNCGHVRGYWSEWKDNGTSAVSSTNIREVKTEEVTVTVSQYRYSRTVWYSSSGTYSSSKNPPKGYSEGTVKKGSKTYRWDYSDWYDTAIEVKWVTYEGYSTATSTYNCGGTTYYNEEVGSKSVTETHYFYRDVIYY